MYSGVEVIVEIPQGKLRGLKELSSIGDTYYSFQGIPYGKPPVGEFRFKASELAEGWEGVRDATVKGSQACCAHVLRPTVYLGNEDCLFANVFINELPGRTTKKKPVLVWIHGGGFSSGSGNQDLNSPEIFMHYDVVVVTFNYRVGAFGFLSLRSSQCPGNYGLKDQRLLLQWVQKNISCFGGDPDKVTIFGQSSGGASVDYHMLSPSTEGLFKRAISQSPSSTNGHAYSDLPRESAFLLGKRLGCQTDDENVLLDFLRKAPAESIVFASQFIRKELFGQAPGEQYFCYHSFAPTAEPESEEAFITEYPSVLKKKYLFHDVPYMTGVCTREMIGMGVKNEEDFPDWKTDAEFRKFLPRELKLKEGSEKALNIARKFREYYYKDGPNVGGFIDIISDSYFNYEVFRTVRSLLCDKNRKSPAWLYTFSYEGQRNTYKELFNFKIPGTAHTDDVGYLFKTTIAPLPDIKPDTPDTDFMLKLTKLWVDFATNGEPSPEMEWPPVDLDFTYLDLGNDITVKTGFFKERMDLWDEVFRMANK